MPRPSSNETTDPRHVIDLGSEDIGDVIEINPDYLVVRRRSDSITYFIPRDVLRGEGNGWRLIEWPGETTWEQWRAEPADSEWAPGDGDRVLTDAQRRAATERSLTRVIRSSDED